MKAFTNISGKLEKNMEICLENTLVVSFEVSLVFGISKFCLLRVYDGNTFSIVFEVKLDALGILLLNIYFTNKFLKNMKTENIFLSILKGTFFYNLKTFINKISLKQRQTLGKNLFIPSTVLLHPQLPF